VTKYLRKSPYKEEKFNFAHDFRGSVHAHFGPVAECVVEEYVHLVMARKLRGGGWGPKTPFKGTCPVT
jgi:hypothetical protein